MKDQVLQSPSNPHFFQPLLPGFHSHLSIPVKFFKLHLDGRYVAKTVNLRSDACEGTWKVKMEGRRVTVGWKEFATAHDLRIGDFVIFRQRGDLVFHVTCFGPSLCEIQYVHSGNNEDDCHEENVRNLSMKQKVTPEPQFSQDDHDSDDEEEEEEEDDSYDDDDEYNIGKFPRDKHVKKRKLEAEAHSFSPDQSYFVAHVTESNLRVDTLFLPRWLVRSNGLNQESNTISIFNERVMKTWTLNLRFRKSNRTFYMRAGWSSFCHENSLEPGDSVTFKLECNNNKPPLLCFSTTDFKKRSQRASSLNEDRFVKLTATPNSLKHGRLYLPKSLTRVYKLEKEGSKKITMLDKHGVEWPVNLLLDKRSGEMRLGSGLKEFFKANDIKACESFVVELVWKDVTTPTLKLCSKET